MKTSTVLHPHLEQFLTHAPLPKHSLDFHYLRYCCQIWHQNLGKFRRLNSGHFLEVWFSPTVITLNLVGDGKRGCSRTGQLCSWFTEKKQVLQRGHGRYLETVMEICWNYNNTDFWQKIQIEMRPVQDFAFERSGTWWNKSNVEEYHKNMTKVHPNHIQSPITVWI